MYIKTGFDLSRVFRCHGRLNKVHMKTKMSIKLLQQRHRAFSSIIYLRYLKSNYKCFSVTSHFPRKAPSKDESQDKEVPSSTVGVRHRDRLGHLMQLYEDIVGLTEVKLAQEKVVNAELKFLQVQEDRRAMQQELLSVQAEVRAVGAELEKTSRTDSRYIDLVKKEHEALLIEKEMSNKIKTLDKAERDFFALLSAALRESHEKERARAEKTKYWSIIGSVIGAIIGIVGSTFNNMRRMKELRAIVSESGANTAEYKALAGKMLESVLTQQSQVEGFVESISNLEHVNNQTFRGPLFVSGKDFSKHTEVLLSELHHQSETLAKHFSDIQKQLAVQRACENNDQIIYVGPDLEQMFLRTQQKLEADLQKHLWLTSAACAGLIVVSLCVFLFKGSS